MAGPIDSNLAALVLAQAAATPDATAILAESGAVSYRTLAARVAAITAFLRRRGLADEEPVGVLMKRTPDMIAALLAILHSGGAYVPLDPDDPSERNRRIRRKSGAALVLTDRELGATALPEADLEFAVVGDLVSPEPLPPAAPGGARLAYILFTSGSTGEPKGVEIEHRAALNLLFAARDLFGFTAADRYLATATIGFDVSVPEIFLPLLCGGAVLLRDRQLWLDPRDLAAEVRAQGVTVLPSGPSAWAVALAEVPDFPRVRVAITTGEPVPPALAQRLLAVGDTVWNLYGPTETTVWSTAHRVTADRAGDSAISACIGRPIANTTVHVIDAEGHAAPPGTEGELWIGGLGLARGYRGDPTLTRERFAPHPVLGHRCYRTGDLVTQRPGGELVYFGRNDDQMKIRGVRIEPREVEAAILACPGVLHAAATWFEGASGARAIVAAVVPQPGRTLTAVQLHTSLAARLSPSMVPSRWIFADTLPRTPSGKVDRNAIRRQADAAQPAAATAGGRALSTTEAELAGIWRRILNLATVAPDDHFFAIGGDSLAAVRMVTEAEQRFGVRLPVQTVFEAPTLARLAALIGRAQGDTASAQTGYIFPLVEAGRGRPVFFSNVDLKLAARGAWAIDAPLYGISHWAQGSGFLQADSVEALAAIHLAAIRAIQPAGPYRLAGFSFGGVVVFEMAQQLRRAGETVELLFLLDPMHPFRSESAPGGYAQAGQLTPLDETWAGWARRHARALRRNPRQLGNYIGEKLRWHARNSPVKQWLVYHLVHLHGRRPNPISRLIVPRNRWPGFWYAIRRLSEHYVARRYDGPVLAIFPGEGERHAAWRELIGPAGRIEIVAARHCDLFEPAERALWQEPLARTLEAAQPR
ncbi:MAG: amino acid adenylation domain-containing protein [Opitutaceae bacterium]|nr:amino acid adenylation domain-containing protein [Opitutaceae bacterium]